jgi:urease accessory protein
MRDEKCSNAGTSGDEGNGNAAPPLGRSADSPAHDAALVTWLPMLLQTTDALFPTGAYAHSLGFEELLRLCGVRDEVGLRELVDTHVLPVLMHQDLPYLRFAYQTVEGPALWEIDREISAWKVARELREASIQVGRRRLAALRAVADCDRYRNLAHAIAAGEAAGHHLTVCAAQALAEGAPLAAALTAYMYQSVAGLCSAALKLIRIGQEGCQRVLRHAMMQAERVVETSLLVEREDAGWFDPLLEIASMRHEFANERLFIS